MKDNRNEHMQAHTQIQTHTHAHSHTHTHKHTHALIHATIKDAPSPKGQYVYVCELVFELVFVLPIKIESSVLSFFFVFLIFEPHTRSHTQRRAILVFCAQTPHNVDIVP